MPSGALVRKRSTRAGLARYRTAERDQVRTPVQPSLPDHLVGLFADNARGGVGDVHTGIATPVMLSRMAAEPDRIHVQVRELIEARDRLDAILMAAPVGHPVVSGRLLTTFRRRPAPPPDCESPLTHL